MKRSPLSRKKQLKPGKKGLKRSGRLRPFGRKGKRDRDSGRVFGELSSMVRKAGFCQAQMWTPGKCDGPLEIAHARARGMGGGRGDWIKESTGQVVGNILLACRSCHQYSDAHPEQCEMPMRAMAWQNGMEALFAGIEPVL